MSNRWFLGVDWGSRVHALCLMDQVGTVVGRWTVAHDVSQLDTTVRAALDRVNAPPSDVQVGIEVPRGALIDFFLDRGFAVHAINPKQLERCRDRYTATGAKDDARDAWVLADALRSTPKAFRPLSVSAAWVVEIRELSRLWDDLEADVRRFANRLSAQLHRITPALWTLCPGADEAWLWDLLELMTRDDSQRHLTRSRITRVLQAHRIRRLTADDILRVLQRPGFSLAPGVEAAAGRHVAALLPQLRAAADARRRCRTEMERLLQSQERAEEQSEHRDVALLRSVPGLGMWTAATMLGEAAAPLGERDYHRLRTLAGTAPVTQQSGLHRVVRMRRACHPRLRQAVYHWALASLAHDEPAHAYYHRLRHRGITHGTALRCVGDRWLRILTAMLATQTRYDASRYAVAA